MKNNKLRVLALVLTACLCAALLFYAGGRPRG